MSNFFDFNNSFGPVDEESELIPLMTSDDEEAIRRRTTRSDARRCIYPYHFGTRINPAVSRSKKMQRTDSSKGVPLPVMLREDGNGLYPHKNSSRNGTRCISCIE